MGRLGEPQPSPLLECLRERCLPGPRKTFEDDESQAGRSGRWHLFTVCELLALKPVSFLLHRPNLLILLRWTSRGSASTRACSRPCSRMFRAAFTSLSMTSPHLGQSWTLSVSSFGTISPHPEHFCDVPLGLTSITRPPRLSAL